MAAVVGEVEASVDGGRLRVPRPHDGIGGGGGGAEFREAILVDDVLSCLERDPLYLVCRRLELVDFAPREGVESALVPVDAVFRVVIDESLRLDDLFPLVPLTIAITAVDGDVGAAVDARLPALTPAERSAAGRDCGGGECRYEGERNGAAFLHRSSAVSGYYPRLTERHDEPSRTVPSATLRVLTGFHVALFLPFADIQTRIRAANRRITLIIDRPRFYRVHLPLRRLRAITGNRRHNARFSSLNRRPAS